MVASFIAALLAFVSTNIDDLFLLLLLYGQERRPGAVRLGQYLGFGAILVASVVVSAGAALLRPEWLGFFGLAPFAVGVKALFPMGPRREERARRPGRAGGFLPIATVTFANGGDNIAVYAPLFVGRPPAHLAVMIFVFLLMVPLWGWLALRLSRLPVVATALDRWGHWAAPVVLMGLGVYIFVGSGAAGCRAR
jgi:cadmium resistance protein CadD (predicted permease)